MTVAIAGVGRSQTYSYVNLYDFAGNNSGYNPYGPLTLDGSGNLFGTTVYGGGGNGCGTIFKLSPTNSYGVLYNLPVTYWGEVDQDWYYPFGAYPITGVAQDPNGYTYATTQVDPYGSNSGSVVKIGPNGGGSQIARFPGGSGGANPSAVTLDAYGAVENRAFAFTRYVFTS